VSRNGGWLIALALAAASPAGAQQYTMKMSSPTVNDLQIEWMNAFKKGVDARSGNRVKIEIYPANQLGQIPRTVEGATLGTIEVTMVATGFLVGVDPRYQIFDAVGLFDDMKHGMAVLNDPEVRKLLATFGTGKGVEPLTTIVHSPVAVLSRKPIRTIADFQGQKIRTTGTLMQAEPLKKLGASPIQMPLGEVMPALQSGTIDGFFAGTTIFTAFKFYDVAKGLTYIPKSYIVSGAILNQRWLASLPPDLQAIIREEAGKANSVVLAWGVEDVERARKAWEQNGGQSILLSAADQKQLVQDFTTATAPLLGSNPKVKEAYDALSAAGERARK
jgi:TRAP-type transport system periplasmic protein